MSANALYDMLLQGKKTAVPTLKANEALTPPRMLATPPTNLLTASTAAPTQPPDSLSSYWGQKMGGSNLPLDRFVQLAGTAAKAFDPTGVGGRLGDDLAQMGAGAYGERMKREYEGPNKLLQRQLATAQIERIKNPTESWAAFNKAEMENGNTNVAANYKRYKALGRAEVAPKGHYESDDEGNVSYFEGGKLKTGTGKAKSKTKPVDSSTEKERSYLSYSTLFDSGATNLPANPDGSKMRAWEFKAHVAGMLEKTKVKAPTDQYLMELEGEIDASSGLAENKAAADYFNKHTKGDYDLKYIATEVKVPGALYGTNDVVEKRWVRVTRPPVAKKGVDVKAERASADAAIATGEYDTERIKQNYKERTGLDY